jgi:dephospho-CoA kinase
MLNVGLTGNIAAGKSTVAALFRDWGTAVVDADELVREAQAPGSDVLAAIARRFGAGIIAGDGTLDRPALRAKVMGDDAALADLNAIVHPVVRRRRDELQRAARARGDAMLVHDIPLLFEALDPAAFDAIVLVDAPPAVRQTRLVEGRGLSPVDAQRLIAAQMPAERKRPRADHIIENAGTRAALDKRARRVFDALRRLAAPVDVPWRSTLIATATARDETDLVVALMTRFTDAGVTVRRGAGRRAWVRELSSAVPDAIVATPTAAAGARAAWQGAKLAASPAVHVVSTIADSGMPVDLRPWGADRAWLAVNALP